MSIPMQLLLVVTAFCVLSDGAPDARIARAKQQRPTRGFKNLEMMTARGFGKRGRVSTRSEQPRRFNPKNLMMVARSFGKRSDETADEVYGLDNFWETLAAPEREGQEMEDESIPLDWFVNEIVNNPDFARSVVRKFVDINQDGMLSSDELLRNV
ncbi:allatotropin-like isoform X1 [Cydia strobilella]|uniref:allatotropin-like isoform X1 n=1 Tax=Cydia strobilella TaxID=1100964 RepID=UPI003006932C